jgi:hypothetical protein
VSKFKVGDLVRHRHGTRETLGVIADIVTTQPNDLLFVKMHGSAQLVQHAANMCERVTDGGYWRGERLLYKTLGIMRKSIWVEYLGKTEDGYAVLHMPTGLCEKAFEQHLKRRPMATSVTMQTWRTPDGLIYAVPDQLGTTHELLVSYTDQNPFYEDGHEKVGHPYKTIVGIDNVNTETT